MNESMNALSREVCDQETQNLKCLDTISCTTFNILAPIYKRLGEGVRESEFRESWHSRNESILDTLLRLKSSVICLQEFWVGNEELAGMYQKRLHEVGYLTYQLARTNNRGDGLLTAVHQSKFRLLNYRELLFNDIGDRVAQILHVELRHDFSQSNPNIVTKEAIIVNTHLIFPHDSRCCFLRLQQVYKILQYIRSYIDNCGFPLPIILCGDWNGSKKGHVYKFLRSQGFISCYDIAHNYKDETENSQKWISHRNHRGNICGVDFIWLHNPQKFQKPLKDSFAEAMLGNVKNVLHKVIVENGGQMPGIIKTKGSSITYSDFSQALVELGISGQPYGGLSDEDVKEIWKRIDADGDGIADVPNFVTAWNLCVSCQHEERDKEINLENEEGPYHRSAATIRFVVKKARLWPPEAEEGMWPENYSLSDHALLTVEFGVVFEQ
ncbi:hypothetical protein Cgig2_022448 [Carnegiea gigantea]|uniref:EF-hand domain-containing protein n=1 Tax=Carnegiea gigantea TaxID=171969 RepID=A0A9Q1KAH7_9CARY|nr:hypothetical protein Cgig2_022448 [Carnegiea gigantea]